MITKSFNDGNFSSSTALILVGGLGTRLRSVVSDVPKPMAPIHGKPFLYYKMKQIKNAGIKKIVFCSGYLHEIIEKYFGDGSKYGISIEYSVENKSLGTAGAIKNAEKLIDKTQPFFVLNGDTYLNVDFQKMWSGLISRNAKHIMLLTAPHNINAEGNVITDDNMELMDFLEKPTANALKEFHSSFINAGVYLLSPEILDIIEPDKKVSFERDIFPNIIGKGKEFYGVEYLKGGYFIDIGIPKNYKQFTNDIAENKVYF